MYVSVEKKKSKTWTLECGTGPRTGLCFLTHSGLKNFGQRSHAWHGNVQDAYDFDPFR